MASPALRPHFNQSRLVRLLDALAQPALVESKQSFAERLGQWLGVNDAIVLASALANGMPGAPAAASGASAAADAALPAEFARLRGALLQAMDGQVGAAGASGRVKWPTPTEADTALDFSPYHRYYLARQREIETRIGPLRARVRAALAARTPALRRLAMLDAALDQALGARERQALGTLPLLLERRFRVLTAASGAAADRGLAAFRDDLHHVLCAEADLRLQPVAGMIDALNNEIAKQR